MAWKLPPDQNAMGGVFGANDMPLWLRSGMQQAPAPAPYQAGDFQRSGPQMRSTGPLESVASALLPQRDEGGIPKPMGAADILNAALWVVPGARGARAAAPEKITGAAVRTNAGIFDGVTHATAAEKAAAKGVDISKLDLNDIDGFLTSTGRYVSREEAAKIADAFGQTRSPGAARLESSVVNYEKGDKHVVTREEAMRLHPTLSADRVSSPFYVVGKKGQFMGASTREEADLMAR